MKLFFSIWLLASMLQGNMSMAQTQPPYQIPDSYRFDYEVTQMLVHKKNVSDTSVMHFLYTKTGEYAAARISSKNNMKGNLLVVITSDGMSIIFDEHSKNITIISIRKLISDLSGISKWIRMDSLTANLRKKTDGKDFQSVKTGNNKQVGGYTSEEYSVSDNKGHKGSVWCAKVDFNTQTDYILGAVGGNLFKMMGGHMTTHPLFQAISQPKTLVTDIDGGDSTDKYQTIMHTLGINQSTTTVSTTGYMVNNYSNMTLPEIFQAEMKKRNH
ncbi:MAG TPA: hypothetical protein VGZ90_12880 [Puia sp.]|nr:hypothetical protein [Puia sp.]